MVSVELHPKNSTNVRILDAAGALFRQLRRLACPADEAEYVARDLLTPERVVLPPMLPEPAGPSVPVLVPGHAPHLNVRSWGQGPAVLLLHGWDGQLYDMGGFVEPLVAAGYRVVAFDAPAHGRSAGEQASVLDYAAAVTAVAKVVGPLHGAIAHSMGATALLLAMADGVTVDRTVFVGTPLDPVRLARRAAVAARLTADQTQQMLDIVDGLAGRPLAGISVAGLAARLRSPALFLHCTHDTATPVGEVLRVAACWSGARVHLTEAAGHRGILNDGACIGEATRFVAG